MRTHEDIQSTGFIENFFVCPIEYQEVIFMMVTGESSYLAQSTLYMEN